MKEGDWKCPFHITGLGTKYGYGVDAIQAVSVAPEGIRVTLAKSEYRLSWLGGEPGYTGFDRLVTTAFGQKFTNRLNAKIDREIRKLGKALEQRARAKRS